jgi:hypothetical protein
MNIQNISFNNNPSINDIYTFDIWNIPFNFIKNIHLTDKKYYIKNKNIKITNHTTSHPAEWYYKIHDLQNNPSTLTLSQSYHDGWLAYYFPTSPKFLSKFFPFLGGEKLEEHVLVNNWANGWEITPPQSPPSQGGEEKGGYSIIIIFWPQYLQYIGYIFLVGTFLYLLPYEKIKELRGK